MALLFDVFNAFNNFAHQEGLSLYFVDAVYFNVGEFSLEEIGEHAGVELGYYYTFVVAEYFGCVCRKRVDVAEVCKGNVVSIFAELFCCCV